MNSNGRIHISSAVAVAVLLTAGFLSLQFLQPSPRFLAGFPEALSEGQPVLKGPKDHPVFIVKQGGRVISLDPSCVPPPGSGASLSCRLEWKAVERVFSCPCDETAGYDTEGRSLAEGKPAVSRHKTSLAPDGQIIVDRSVTFAEKDWLIPGAELFLVPPVKTSGGM